MGVTLPTRWAQDVPLRELTTWRIGGPARYVSRPPDLAALRDDLWIARSLALPVFLIGAGANLLFPDTGYRGLIVRLPGGEARLSAQPEEGALRVAVPAGASLAPLARSLSESGHAGLEWAEGIPGTVGGAVINNAGAYGGEISGVVASVEVLGGDGREEIWPAERLGFGYRSSALKGREPTGWIVTGVNLRLSPGDPRELACRLEDYRARRAARTPAGASCGSVFRNPPGEAAGRLIERCGLRGARVGEAQVAEKHANYILNLGGARSSDALALLRLVRRRVREETGIDLALEIQLVGFPEALTREFA